jgi:hypothetical protein
VGIEIDYENNTSPNLTALQAFINAYRAILPYDATGANPAARLTIDLAAGDQYLVPLAAKATTDWLNTSAPVLDYANAMVPNKQPNSASSAESNWQQHISGYPRITPPVPPLAPAKMTGSLYIVTGKHPAPECTTFSSSLENSTGTYVETVAPAGAGSTPGMLGMMFWAAECQGAHSICTTPPNTCQGGVGVGSHALRVNFWPNVCRAHVGTRVLLRNPFGPDGRRHKLVLMGKLVRSPRVRGKQAAPLRRTRCRFSYVIFQLDEKMVRRKEGGAGSVGSIQGL